MKEAKKPVKGKARERCSECGAEIHVRVSTVKEPYLYDQSGLANVYLIGVKVLTCAGCGRDAVQIPLAGDLHRAIAHAIFHKPNLLNGDEVKYLRKNAGLMAKDFAAFIRITPVHLSRVENGKMELGESADKLARLVAMAPCADADEYRRFLRSPDPSSKATGDEKTVFQLKNSGWADAA